MALVLLAAAGDVMPAAVVRITVDDCWKVFGMLSPADWIDGTEFAADDTCVAGDFVGVTADRWLELVAVTHEDAASLLPTTFSRAWTPFASEQNMEPISTGLEPKFAVVETVNVGPSVTVPFTSWKA